MDILLNWMAVVGVIIFGTFMVIAVPKLTLYLLLFAGACAIVVGCLTCISGVNKEYNVHTRNRGKTP